MVTDSRTVEQMKAQRAALAGILVAIDAAIAGWTQLEASIVAFTSSAAVTAAIARTAEALKNKPARPATDRKRAEKPAGVPATTKPAAVATETPSESVAIRAALLACLRRQEQRHAQDEAIPSGLDGGQLRQFVANTLALNQTARAEQRFRVAVGNGLSRLKADGMVTRTGSWWLLAPKGREGV